eukprot:8721126-Alexandrium_andersonii.AAC.1
MVSPQASNRRKTWRTRNSRLGRITRRALQSTSGAQPAILWAPTVLRVFQGPGRAAAYTAQQYLFE